MQAEMIVTSLRWSWTPSTPRSWRPLNLSITAPYLSGSLTFTRNDAGIVSGVTASAISGVFLNASFAAL